MQLFIKKERTCLQDKQIFNCLVCKDHHTSGNHWALYPRYRSLKGHEAAKGKMLNLRVMLWKEKMGQSGPNRRLLSTDVDLKISSELRQESPGRAQLMLGHLGINEDTPEPFEYESSLVKEILQISSDVDPQTRTGFLSFVVGDYLVWPYSRTQYIDPNKRHGNNKHSWWFTYGNN